jgi:hypothetical protein
MNATPWSALRRLLRRTTALACLASGFLLGNPMFAHASPAWTAATSYGSPGSDIGQAVKVDTSGNRYITGAFSATANFPTKMGVPGVGFPPARKPLTSAGGTDGFLAKYDSSGNLVWMVAIGGPNDDQGFDIGFDSTGNVYLAGYFEGSATFQAALGSGKTVTGSEHTIFLAKYSSVGALDWVETGANGGGTANNGYGVAVDAAAGSIYVTGLTEGGGVTFSSSDGSAHSISAVTGSWHMFITKYDTNGKFQWGQQNAAGGNSVAHKCAVDSQHNVYITGWMEGNTTFFSNNGNNITIPGFSSGGTNIDFPDDAYIVKYDASGNAKWANHVGGNKGIATDIATSSDGRVSITGFVGNDTGTDTIATSQAPGQSIDLGTGIVTDPYNKDVFFATWNSSSGVLLDARRYGGAGDDGGSGIGYDAHNNLIISGTFTNQIEIEGATLTGRDPSSLFVASFMQDQSGHYPPNGPDDVTLHFARAADGPGSNVVDGAAENNPRLGLTASGDILVTGSYGPTAQFNGFSLKAAGSSDMFLALLSLYP